MLFRVRTSVTAFPKSYLYVIFDIVDTAFKGKMEDLKNTEVQKEPEAEQSESIKYEECNKPLHTSEEVELNAGHSNLSESTVEKKPLTEEEKKEQLKKVEELMRQKRKDREEKEKADQLEQEKRRIQSGKELGLIRKKLEDEAIKKLAEERRREKEEEKRARQKVMDMIAQDKLDRKKNLASSSPVASAAVVPLQPQTVPSTPKEYKETRIQIRLTNGSTLTHIFGVKEQLASIRLYIEMNRTDVDKAGSNPFKLQTNFPRHIFTEEEYEKPLDSLGLVPSAVLIVSRI